ncbi:MAG: DNA cytosine methyltransferase [Clostridiales bacterium]|jgi:DNA (cytosine-5)-methyltransferase 1|nr:DNA cytosine methyltransferase [Clostridiales bacterium]
MHEFFAGSGLVAYGLRGMFRPVWSNDISEKKAAVYYANFWNSHFELNDIRCISGCNLPCAHLSWASFPCQDLSLAGSINGIDAKRSGLVWEWLRILNEMPRKPYILCIENVEGLLTAKKGEYFKRLHYELLSCGYKSGAIVVDAIHFVPQSRPRVFTIAVKAGMEIPQDLVGNKPNWLHNKAASDLGKALPDWIWWKADEPSPRETTIKDVIDQGIPFDKDNALRLIPRHHLKRLEEYDEFIAAGYRRTRQGKQCLELRFDGAAGCLRTPEGGSSKQFLVVKQDGELHARTLTAREAARLMGAPDDYILPEHNDGYRAMGDAVALPVAKFIGKVFLVRLAAAIYGTDKRRSHENISS